MPENEPASARKVSSGDVLHLTRAASVQFIRPIFVRVIRLPDWVTYDGWLWIEGYELGRKGEAVTRRSLFVQTAGLIWQDGPVPAPGRPAGGLSAGPPQTGAGPMSARPGRTCRCAPRGCVATAPRRGPAVRLNST